MATANRWMILVVLAAICLGGCADGADPSLGNGDTADEPEATAMPWAYRLVLRRTPAVEGLKGIALGDDGRIYLASASGVTVFDGDWVQIGHMPTPGPVTAVAVGPEGRVFATEKARVHVFGSDGTLVSSWGRAGEGHGELGYVTGIAVHGVDVWLADAGNRALHHFDVTGDLVDSIAGRDETTGQPRILCPSPYMDVAAGTDGEVMITNPGYWRVERYSRGGERLGYWGGQGTAPNRFPGCCNPTNLALSADGYVVTAEKGRSPRVKVSDGQGQVLGIIGTEFFAPASAGMDLAVDAGGRVFVVDPAQGAVLVFERMAEEG
ncbi:MAG TPA: NHL repeat-containing protein [Phycisphaerae bacterium]|nr:NHL repeat-containing protein [Phycisphaerae bacterium]